MPVLIDYSQVALSTIFQFQKDLKKNSSNNEAVNIIRHAVLSGIKFYNKKYKDAYGDLILACDGKNYWRKDIFPYYKANRKTARQKSDLDWHLIFDTISTIKDEISENFPYKVICVDRAEADDIIAVLCKWYQQHETIDMGVFEELQPILIISSDGDFKQLQKYSNVKQWSPIQKKFIVCENAKSFLNEHIAKAGDDGIPNVLSPDDVFVDENARQTKMMKTRLQQFIKLGRDACQNDEQLKNWDRNNNLINLDLIPEDVVSSIINSYKESKPKGNKMTIFNYLVKNKCRLLLNDIEEF